MFWDKVAFAYDFFETVYNGKVYNRTGRQVARGNGCSHHHHHI